MKRSLVAEFFIIFLLVFVVMGVIQYLLLNNYFSDFYHGSMLSDMQKEFDLSTETFSGGDYSSIFIPTRQYMVKNEAPVLIINENYEICDRTLIDKLPTVTVQMSDDRQNIKVPIIYMQELSEESIGDIFAGRILDLVACPVGSNNQLYEPLKIMMGGNSYTNTTSQSDYREMQEALIDGRGVVVKCRLPQDTAINYCAVKIYNEIKDCMITHGDIETLLEELSSGEYSYDGSRYQYLVGSRSVEGVQYYFVTLRRIIFSSDEARYYNRYSLLIYICICVIILMIAYIISRRIAKPIVTLSSVAERIASLDFSVKADIKRPDQLGILSESLNHVAFNLESVLGELKKNNDNLKLSAEKARDDEKRLRELLDDLSHECKTPLMNISLYVEALENEIVTGEKERYYSKIDSEIDRMTVIINDIIEFSRLSLSNWVLRTNVFDISELIREIFTSFDIQIKNKGYEIDFDLRDDAFVVADKLRIQQVLTNLISNAIKYSEPKHYIRVQTVTTHNSNVKVSISNNGYVSDTDMQQIWKRYYRSSTKKETTLLPSQGVGLEIVRTILLRHKSEFGVVREDGLITFYFTLPCSPDDYEC